MGGRQSEVTRPLEATLKAASSQRASLRQKGLSQQDRYFQKNHTDSCGHRSEGSKAEGRTANEESAVAVWAREEDSLKEPEQLDG